MSTRFRSLLAVVLLLVISTACTPQIELLLHRRANPDPDSPYARAHCASPEETGVGRWDCPARRVEQLRLEANRRRAEWRRRWIAQHAIPFEANWDRVAHCESTGNWSINTGNGYYGGLQFNLQTWQAYGGTGYPHHHSKRTQIIVAERLRAARGLQPWPHCGPRWYG